MENIRKKMGRPAYGGKFAKAHEQMALNNHSEPANNSEILARAEASADAFYEQHFAVLGEIQKNIRPKS